MTGQSKDEDQQRKEQRQVDRWNGETGTKNRGEEKGLDMMVGSGRGGRVAATPR